MLRKTAAGLERLNEDGSWSLAEPTTVAPEIRGELDLLVAEHDNGTSNGTTPAEESPDVEAEDSSPGEVLDIAVPGLLSTDGRRSTAGQSRLKKLQAKAQHAKPGSRITARAPRVGKQIVVPATAAEVTGPDASQKARAGETRRIVTRETPVLLENRPRWVKDLFESHFRSELALTLRHLPMGKNGKNRMKLSRADYAIGWLVMFDKARADPGILRLREGN